MVQRLKQRIEVEAPGDEGELLAAAMILTGLRLNTGLVKQLFQGVPKMRESSGYQIILEEGRAEGEIKGVRATNLRQVEAARPAGRGVGSRAPGDH